MTGSLDREKGLLYDASVHLRFGEDDMDQTGQNIIDAAMELVVERGYTATTTKDIAKRAGVNECTIFRKFKGKKEIVLQAMGQKRWHPDLEPDDFMIETGNLTEDLCQFARIYMKKVTPEFVKLSLGLRTPELAEDTREGILAIPQVFKTGVTAYFRKMYEKGKLISDDYESMAMMFLSLNFGFVFFKASFGSGLTEMKADEYIIKMVDAFVHGVAK